MEKWLQHTKVASGLSVPVCSSLTTWDSMMGDLGAANLIGDRSSGNITERSRILDVSTEYSRMSRTA
jgi:hypothetical protein